MNKVEFFDLNLYQLGEICNSNIEKALSLWRDLSDVPVNEDDEIDSEFLDFPIGTCKFDIWHWFEDSFNVSVAKDLMN